MLTLHLEHQGKTAKVSLHALPPARPKLAISARTSKGPVTSLKIRNGLNLKAKPASLTAQDLIAGDPELELKGAGQTIFSEDLTAAWFDPAAPEPGRSGISGRWISSSGRMVRKRSVGRICRGSGIWMNCIP